MKAMFDPARSWRPNVKPYNPRQDEDKWDEHKHLLAGWHASKMPRKNMLQKLHDLGFYPSLSQLNTKMKSWNFAVYTSSKKVVKRLMNCSSGRRGLSGAVEQIQAPALPADAYPNDVGLPETIQSLERDVEFHGPCQERDELMEETMSRTDVAERYSDQYTLDDHIVSTTPVVSEDFSKTGIVQHDNVTNAPRHTVPLPLTESNEEGQFIDNPEAVMQHAMEALDDSDPTNPTVLIKDIMHDVTSNSHLAEVEKHDVLQDVAVMFYNCNMFPAACLFFEHVRTYMVGQRDATNLAKSITAVNCVRAALLQPQVETAQRTSSDVLRAFTPLLMQNDKSQAHLALLREMVRDINPHETSFQLRDMQRDQSLLDTASKCPNMNTRQGEFLLQSMDPFLDEGGRRELLPWIKTIFEDGCPIWMILRWCQDQVKDYKDQPIFTYSGLDAHCSLSRANFASLVGCYLVRKWLKQLSEVESQSDRPLHMQGSALVTVNFKNTISLIFLFAKWAIEIAGKLDQPQSQKQRPRDSMSHIPLDRCFSSIMGLQIMDRAHEFCHQHKRSFYIPYKERCNLTTSLLNDVYIKTTASQLANASANLKQLLKQQWDEPVFGHRPHMSIESASSAGNRDSRLFRQYANQLRNSREDCSGRRRHSSNDKQELPSTIMWDSWRSSISSSRSSGQSSKRRSPRDLMDWELTDVAAKRGSLPRL